MRSMSMYNLPIYLIFLALLEALCWWMGAWFWAALFSGTVRRLCRDIAAQ